MTNPWHDESVPGMLEVDGINTGSGLVVECFTEQNNVHFQHLMTVDEF